MPRNKTYGGLRVGRKFMADLLAKTLKQYQAAQRSFVNATMADPVQAMTDQGSDLIKAQERYRLMAQASAKLDECKSLKVALAVLDDYAGQLDQQIKADITAASANDLDLFPLAIHRLKQEAQRSFIENDLTEISEIML